MHAVSMNEIILSPSHSISVNQYAVTASSFRRTLYKLICSCHLASCIWICRSINKPIYRVILCRSFI